MTLKPILLYENKDRPIKDPHSIQILAKREGARILHHENFTVRPYPIFHDAELGIIVVLIEFERRQAQPRRTFESTMDRLRAQAEVS